MSFKGKLITLLVLLIIPLIVSDVYFHYRQYLRSQANILSQQEQLASSFAGDTDVFVARTVAVERAIGQALITSRWPTSKVKQDYISSALDSVPTLRWIAFADTSGKVIEASSPEVLGVSISDRNYFRQLVAGDAWRVSDVLVTRGERQVGFVIATPIRDHTNTFRGVVIAAINEHTLLTALRAQPSTQNELVLVDSRGFVSFMSDKPNLPYPQRDWSIYPFVTAALHGKPQYIDSFSRPDRPVMMGAMVPISTLGWAAGAFVPRDQVMQPVRRSALRDLFITITVLVFTFILGSVLARQMIKPVESLSAAAEELGHGDLSTRAKVPSTIEFATLAKTMNQMAEQIQQRDQAMHEAYERERYISVTLQKSMLPDVPDRIGRLELATGYFPALHEAEIGGDFYDVIALSRGLVGLVIADVSGKGLTAAVHTAMVRYMLEGFACDNPDPADALRRVNVAVHEFGQDWTFVTAFFGVIDSSSGRLKYANAGHPPPILRRQDGTVEALAEQAGYPLGVAGGAEYRAHELTLFEDDTLVCYTEGVIEARQDGNWFGEEGFRSLLKTIDGPPTLVVDRIYHAVQDFAGGQPSDDIALLVARLESAQSN